MNYRALWIFVVCLASTLLGAEVPSSNASSKPAKDKDTITVKRGSIDPSIDAEGYFEAMDPLEV